LCFFFVYWFDRSKELHCVFSSVAVTSWMKEKNKVGDLTVLQEGNTPLYQLQLLLKVQRCANT
jgi:hypothetical protein